MKQRDVISDTVSIVALIRLIFKNLYHQLRFANLNVNFI